jgi:hypothetical protein
MQLISASGFSIIQIVNFCHHSPQQKLILSVHPILRSTMPIAISLQHSKNGWVWHIKTPSFTGPSTSPRQWPQNTRLCLPNRLGRPQITLPHVPQPITAFRCSVLFNSCWPWSARSFSRSCHFPSTNLIGIPRFWTTRIAPTTLTKGLGVDSIPPHFYFLYISNVWRSSFEVRHAKVDTFQRAIPVFFVCFAERWLSVKVWDLPLCVQNSSPILVVTPRSYITRCCYRLKYRSKHAVSRSLYYLPANISVQTHQSPPRKHYKMKSANWQFIHLNQVLVEIL